MQNRLFNSSYLAIVISIIIIIVFPLNMKGLEHLISWDTFGQYTYLPLFFIEKNFQVPLSYFAEIQAVYPVSSTLYQFNSFGEIAATKYTLGLALLSAPFFLVGHLFAYLLDYPMDGYSTPYAVTFLVSCLFYTVVAVLAFQRMLKYFFNDKTVAWLLIFVLFGTNFFTNAIFDPAYTHTFAFAFLSLLILTTLNFHRNPTVKNGIFLGTTLAILGLIRLPDLLFGLIPVFWNIKQYGSFWKKIRFFLVEKWKPTLFVVLSFLALMSLQFLFWKKVSGEYIMNSYANNPGEGFDWLAPYTHKFLFHFKKGWFIYTPMAIIGMLGFIKMWKKGRNEKIIVISFLIFLYVASSWTTWWYAGSFSQRAMIDIYPLMAIALGTLLSIKKIRKGLLITLGILTVFNQFQAWQYNKRILSREQMTKAYYFSTFGQIKPPTAEQKALLELSPGDFKDFSFQKIDIKLIKNWQIKLEDAFLNKDNIYTQNIQVQLDDVYQPQRLYLLQAEWHYAPSTFEGVDGLIPNFSTIYKNQHYNWRGLDSSSPLLELDTVHHNFKAYYFLPNLRTKKDEIKVQVWRNGERNIDLEKVEIRIFEVLGNKE